MTKVVKRGYVPTDEKEFGAESIPKLRKAGCDLDYLINQGYPIKGASVFVGNHYLLSERQRLALVRAISEKENIAIRKSKELRTHEGQGSLKDCVVNIDGFNTIITLEVAFSGSTLLKCMDGTIRDLAGLRGTYRLIDKTEQAIVQIGNVLESEHIKKAVFYLDAPVSNSGKLKERIIQLLENCNFEVEVQNINNVDQVLSTLENVVTSDAIILDKCKSWFNLTKAAIQNEMGEYTFVDFL